MADWTRPHFQSGPGPHLFYVVLGKVPEELAVSRTRHRVESVPPELQLSRHSFQQQGDWIRGFLQLPGTDRQARFPGGLEPDDVAVVRATLPDQSDLTYLRTTLGIISSLVDQGARAVLDLLALRWWTPDAWLARFVDQDDFSITDHLQIVYTDDERYHPGLWMHTRGLLKFGRPELQIRHLPSNVSELEAAGGALNSIATYLAGGAWIADRQTLQLGRELPAIRFRLWPDDSAQAEPHFNNACLELHDAEATSGLHNLLAAMVSA